jgi:hypothetical protein
VRRIASQFNWQPSWFEHSLGVSIVHGVSVPVHDDGAHEQPDCLVQLTESLNCAHAVSVPAHAEAAVWHPRCDVHVDGVRAVQSVGVPTQVFVVSYEQPGQFVHPMLYSQSAQVVYVGVPEQPAGTLHPGQDVHPNVAPQVAHVPEGVPWQALAPAVQPGQVHPVAAQSAHDVTLGVPEQTCGAMYVLVCWTSDAGSLQQIWPVQSLVCWHDCRHVCEQVPLQQISPTPDAGFDAQSALVLHEAGQDAPSTHSPGTASVESVAPKGQHTWPWAVLHSEVCAQPLGQLLEGMQVGVL